MKIVIQFSDEISQEFYFITDIFDFFLTVISWYVDNVTSQEGLGSIIALIAS